MIPASFDYFRAQSLDEALQLLATKEEARLLAGGHSLVPAMKLRLMQPKTIVDLGRIPELRYLREETGRIAIGAMTTHYEIESSALLREKCPLLPELAQHIGDVQVRHKGTLGGSLAHADPAADWPAAILALDAEMVLVSPEGRRTVSAKDFFVDIMQTALQSNEILSEIRISSTRRSVAYVKTAQKASGFAIAGVAVVLDPAGPAPRVGITGVSAKAYRATAVEAALQGQPLTKQTTAAASAKAAEGISPLSDLHASGEYRVHLAQVNTRRAFELALSRQ